MSEKKDYLSQQAYELYDSTSMPFTNQFISHFALGDSLIKKIGTHQSFGALHFWTASELVILGMMDTKLPFFKNALNVFIHHQQHFLVRNSGGLAVASNEGVLNFSLILPEDPLVKMSITEGYEFMLRLIRQTFKAYGKTIDAYEIEESYCPGDFDLSIDGKKFAGIAQRRLKKGVAIMIYLSVTGSQDKRTEMIRDFYQVGLANETVKWHFPKVNPAVMANLDALLETPLTVDGVKKRILETLKTNGCLLSDGHYDLELKEDYKMAYQKMIERNEQMLAETFDEELSR